MKTEAIAGLATAAGTLVLAAATFSSTRSANRASRLAEQSLLAGLQPVLVVARLDDPRQKVSFQDRHWSVIEGSWASLQVSEDDGVVYMVVPVRNAGSGVAVLQGWHPVHDSTAGSPHLPVGEFRMHGRDMFIAPGEAGFWQAAIRDRSDSEYEPFTRGIRDNEGVVVDVLYSDIHGGQRAISRFSILPAHDGKWLATVSRHWAVDGPSAR